MKVVCHNIEDKQGAILDLQKAAQLFLDRGDSVEERKIRINLLKAHKLGGSHLNKTCLTSLNRLKNTIN